MGGSGMGSTAGWDGRPRCDGLARRDPGLGGDGPSRGGGGMPRGQGPRRDGRPPRDIAPAVGRWGRVPVAGLRGWTATHAWRIRQALGVVAVGAGTAAAVELARRAGAPAWGTALAGLLAALAGAWWCDHRGRTRVRDEEHRHRLLEAVLDEFRSRATAVTLAAGVLRRHASVGEPAGEAGARAAPGGGHPGARRGAAAAEPGSPAAGGGSWPGQATGGGGRSARTSGDESQPAWTGGDESRFAWTAGDGNRSAQATAAHREDLAADTPWGDAEEGRGRPADGADGRWPTARRWRQGAVDHRGYAVVQLEAEAELLRVGALQLACWLRLRAGRVRPERERVDLAAVAERVVRRLAVVAQARQVRLAFTGSPGPAAVVRGDRALLELLCTSLVAVALDRYRSGGRLVVAVDGDGAAVTLAVLEAAGRARGEEGGAAQPTQGVGAGPGPVPARRSGGTGGGATPLGDPLAGPSGSSRWRRGGPWSLALELTRDLVRLHGGRLRVGRGLPWVVEIPAALGPFGGLRARAWAAVPWRWDAGQDAPGARAAEAWRGAGFAAGPEPTGGGKASPCRRPSPGEAARRLRARRPPAERGAAAQAGGWGAGRWALGDGAPPPGTAGGGAPGPARAVSPCGGWRGRGDGGDGGRSPAGWLRAASAWRGLARGMLGVIRRARAAGPGRLEGPSRPATAAAPKPAGSAELRVPFSVGTNEAGARPPRAAGLRRRLGLRVLRARALRGWALRGSGG